MEKMEKKMENKYNVYAWYRKKDGTTSSAIRVAEGVDIRLASDYVDAYLNREDAEWDAYLVEQSDDPGMPEFSY